MLDPTSPRERPSRWELLRDVFVFQLKLVLDGLRDLLLSPVSLVACVTDFFGARHRTRGNFYRVLQFGRRTEEWIDLFSAGRRFEETVSAGEPARGADAIVEKLESMARREYERGGLTAAAKEAIDRALDVLNKRDRNEKEDRV